MSAITRLTIITLFGLIQPLMGASQSHSPSLPDTHLTEIDQLRDELKDPKALAASLCSASEMEPTTTLLKLSEILKTPIEAFKLYLSPNSYPDALLEVKIDKLEHIQKTLAKLRLSYIVLTPPKADHESSASSTKIVTLLIPSLNVEYHAQHISMRPQYLKLIDTIIDKLMIDATTSSQFRYASEIFDLLAAHQQQHCSNCQQKGTETKTLQKCSRCNAVFYCSKACQIAHWKKTHKKECPQLASHPNLVQLKKIRGDGRFDDRPCLADFLIAHQTLDTKGRPSEGLCFKAGLTPSTDLATAFQPYKLGQRYYQIDCFQWLVLFMLKELGKVPSSSWVMDGYLSRSFFIDDHSCAIPNSLLYFFDDIHDPTDIQKGDYICMPMEGAELLTRYHYDGHAYTVLCIEDGANPKFMGFGLPQPMTLDELHDYMVTKSKGPQSAYEQSADQFDRQDPMQALALAKRQKMVTTIKQKQGSNRFYVHARLNLNRLIKLRNETDPNKLFDDMCAYLTSR